MYTEKEVRAELVKLWQENPPEEWEHRVHMMYMDVADDRSYTGEPWPADFGACETCRHRITDNNYFCMKFIHIKPENIMFRNSVCSDCGKYEEDMKLTVNYPDLFR